MMDPLRNVDANRKYLNDSVFHHFVDQLVNAFDAKLLYPPDVQLAVDLANEIHALHAITHPPKQTDQRGPASDAS